MESCTELDKVGLKFRHCPCLRLSEAYTCNFQISFFLFSDFPLAAFRFGLSILESLVLKFRHFPCLRLSKTFPAFSIFPAFRFPISCFQFWTFHFGDLHKVGFKFRHCPCLILRHTHATFRCHISCFQISHSDLDFPFWRVAQGWFGNFEIFPSSIFLRQTLSEISHFLFSDLEFGFEISTFSMSETF